MIARSFVLSLTLVISTPIFAEEPAEAMQAPAAAESVPMAGGDMQAMAASMKAMADMCQEMMKGEMRAMPVKMAFGALVALVLALLVILEVQWIMYWSRVLRARAIPAP